MLQAVPMAEWSEAQVLEWTALIDLPSGCAEAFGTVFAKMELDERREVAPTSLLLGGDRQGHETHISQEEVPPVLPRRDGADRGRMAAFSGNPRAAAAMCARTAEK